tara:strand:+ start:234853 stop:235206 length:354 start_codon:yes stop_codon:yes gene_type:complete
VIYNPARLSLVLMLRVAIFATRSFFTTIYAPDFSPVFERETDKDHAGGLMSVQHSGQNRFKHIEPYRMPLRTDDGLRQIDAFLVFVTGLFQIYLRRHKYPRTGSDCYWYAAMLPSPD